MEVETVYEVVKKLVGPISPIGQSSADDKRFENLKLTGELISKLIDDIEMVECQNKHSHEHSVKRASDYAKKLKTLALERHSTLEKEETK